MFSKMTKALFFLAFFIAVCNFSGMSAFAAEESNDIKVVTSRDVINYFNWTNDGINSLVNTHEATTFIDPAYNIYELETYRRDIIKGFGSLELTSGFSRSRISTFSNTKTISGVGIDKTVVGVYVFHYETVVNPIYKTSSTRIVATQDKLVTLGLSGLYNETINIDYVGDNYVMLAAKDPRDNSVVYRIFKIVREQDSTRDYLENMQINFYSQATSGSYINSSSPNIVGFGF